MTVTIHYSLLSRYDAVKETPKQRINFHYFETSGLWTDLRLLSTEENQINTTNNVTWVTRNKFLSRLKTNFCRCIIRLGPLWISLLVLRPSRGSLFMFHIKHDLNNSCVTALPMISQIAFLCHNAANSQIQRHK